MKKILHKYLPKKEDFESKNKSLAFLGNSVLHPKLWRLSRNNVALGVAIGLFWCMIPVPFQMIFASVACVYLGANIPIAIVLCWITNPITMAPIFYVSYLFGVLILGKEQIGYQEIANIASLSDIFTTFNGIWWPLYLGSFGLGLIFALIGYFFVSILWKIIISYKWNNRHLH